MSLVFKTIQTEGIAELSYLVGDDEAGVAAVFDPRADCDVYIEAARDAGVSLTHIFEPHIHPDHVMIYPNHGAGSPCGADIGARLTSTIGYERKFNNFLQFTDAKSFSDFAIKTAPPVPRYYPLMKKVNAEGPKVLGSLPRVPGLSPKAFKDAIDKKASVLVDVRNMLAFGGGHIAGALNIAGTPILSIWAGWLLDQEKPILLVLEEDDDLEKILRLFGGTV